MKETFTNIVLNIPHSSDKRCNEGWISDITDEVRKWTDWYTDKLFVCYGVTKQVIFPYSRFMTDVERLIDDELEKIGQGIIYTRFNGFSRAVTDELTNDGMNLYKAHHKALKRLVCDGTMVIDCHSFPNEVCPDVDICLGFNDDKSKPSNGTLQMISHTFELHGFKTAMNHPYSNAISPDTDRQFKSVMIEVNKRCYMNERTLSLNTDYYKLVAAIRHVYRNLLGRSEQTDIKPQ